MQLSFYHSFYLRLILEYIFKVFPFCVVILYKIDKTNLYSNFIHRLLKHARYPFINFTISVHSSCFSSSFCTRCNLHVRFWVARLIKKNGIQPCSVFAAARIRRMKMFSAFFPLPPSDIFLLFRNPIFSPPLSLSSLLSFLPSSSFFFYLGTISSRSTASRTRSPRHSNARL